jgi:hypothetical protein
MIEYRIGNDLKLRLAFVIEGQRVSPALVPFDIRVWTLYPSQAKTASYDGSKWVNCIMIDDYLEVNLNAPQFTSGRLNCDVTLHYPDNEMGDLAYDKIIKVRFDNPLVCPNIQDVIITGEISDTITGLDAYAIAVQEGFGGTRQQWLDSLKEASEDAAETANEAIAEFADAEAARQSQESKRQTQEQERESAENLRDTAEQGRYSAENLRNSAELLRNSNESSRNSAFNSDQANRTTAFNNAETARANAFNTAEGLREDAEDLRHNAEGIRQNQEATRQSQEGTRQSQEGTRQTQETERLSAEAGRVSTEATRQSQEGTRQSQEGTRQTQEQARLSAEAGRVSAEATRQSQEGTRQSQEGTRQTQEQARQATIAGLTAQFEAKIDKASIVQDFGNDEAKVMSQKSITEALANNYWYGIEWDVTVNTSVCTRIGNMDLHRTLPIQSKFVGCLVNKDTTFNRFLPGNSWVGETLDGSAGQVMARLVGFYYKVEEEGNIRRYKMSELPLPGFIYQPASFVGAYEASMNNVTGELSSVMNVSTDYRGGNNDATKDTLDNTFLGRPRTSTSRANYRIAARKINAGDTRWNILDKQRDEVISLLAYVEYANRNLQLPFNGELDANGFKQGGLGMGVTGLSYTKWVNWNGANPFVPCGYTNSLGNNSGEIAYTMPFGYDASGHVNYKGEYESLTAYVNGNYISQGQLLYKCIADAIAGTAIENTNYFTPVTRTVVYVNKYRAVEIPYGHIYKNLDQVIVDVKSADDNGGVASSKIYVCNDPKNYADTITSNYVYAGDLPLTDGYVKDVQMGENANLAPKVVGAGSTTHWADYHYTNVESSSLRAFLVGGNANSANAGFRYSNVDDSVSNTRAHIGARLCLILKNETT